VTGNAGYFSFNGTSTLTWSAVPEPTGCGERRAVDRPGRRSLTPRTGAWIPKPLSDLATGFPGFIARSCRFKPFFHGFAPWKWRMIPKLERISRCALTSSQPERAGQCTP